MNRSFDTSQMTSVSTSGFDAIEMSPTNVESSGGGGGDGGRKEKRRSVRLVHCGDGVIEECDEDIEERMRSRKQELEQQLAEEKRLEIESVRDYHSFFFCLFSIFFSFVHVQIIQF